MHIHSTGISDLVVVGLISQNDSRGGFIRAYCDNELASIIGHRKIRQINHSRTVLVGTIRGLHFQHPPHAEMKLVRCVRGKVWDIAVDIRRNSSTFLKWHAEELTPENNRMLIIPEGFAHGFQTLEPDTELLYLHTEFYAPGYEGGIQYNDPTLSIQWPIPVSNISDRDSKHPFIAPHFTGI